MKRSIPILLFFLSFGVMAWGQSPAYIMFSPRTDLDVAYVIRVPLDTLGYVAVTHIKAQDSAAWRQLTEDLHVASAQEGGDSTNVQYRLFLVSKENPAVRIKAGDTQFDVLFLDPERKIADVFHLATKEQMKRILSNILANTHKTK